MAPFYNLDNYYSDESSIIEDINFDYRSYVNEQIREFKIIDNILFCENGILFNYSIIYGIMEIQKWLIEKLPNKYHQIMKKYMLITNSNLVDCTYNEIKLRRNMLDKLNNDYICLVDKLKVEIINYIVNNTEFQELFSSKSTNIYNLSIYDLIKIVENE